MNKYVLSETKQHVMKLRQIGADVNIISSQMVYVSFEINEFVKVAYVYNINKKGRYFLERIKPYPIPVREFTSAKDVYDIIKIDIEQFRNAVKSHHISDFIALNYKFHDTILMFEDIFLYYNLDASTIEEIKESVAKIHKTIAKAKETANRVYFKKEPDNL